MSSAPLRSALLALTAASLLAVGTGGAALARPVAGLGPGAGDVLTGAPRVAAQLPAVPRTAGTDLACDLLDGLRLCTHGDDARLAEAGAPTQPGGTSSTSSTRIGCYRSDGPRVQAVYARPATARDRYSSSLRSFQGWAGAVEKAVNDSAGKTRGARHVRFASVPSGSSCTLSVLNVTLPADAFTSFSATVSALREVGLDKQDVKYLVWADASGYCGVASTYLDDAPGQENLNNGRFPSYARIDQRCWGRVETHELMHMLGAVQRGAPHATDGLHCSDGSDVMCYDDGTRGSRQTSVCGASHSRLLDCRGDDYFSTAPPARSYLATHWNTASSAFLARGWSDPAPAAPAPASPRPTTGSSPSPRSSASPAPSPSPSPSPSRGPVRAPLLPVPVPTLLQP